ncbi:MAG: hypothetical protein JWL73_2087 [Actinomycetia bacterium]|nr:hypothetical protein [Actinomycetes bacterium]
MLIPVEVDELTPAWLTEALQARAPGVEVATVDVLDAHSGTTGRARIAVTYADDTAGTADADGSPVPSSFFVKLAPFNPEQRKFIEQNGIGVAEARLYATVGAELPMRVPEIWLAHDDGTGYVMILEDLVPSGCRFPSAKDPDVAERTLQVVEGLARLHAQYWESPRFDTDLGWVPTRAGFGPIEPKSTKKMARAAGGFVRKALDLFGDEMPAAFMDVGTIYVERTADVLDLWDEGERTLIHGDPHMGNLFTDGPAIGFLDWAMTSHSPGMRDVAYFLGNSVPTDVRRALQDDLLVRYRELLSENGVEIDAATIEAQYRLFAVYSWVSATSTAAVGDRWQTAAVGRGGMARSTQTLEDLDSAGILRELLA